MPRGTVHGFPVANGGRLHFCFVLLDSIKSGGWKWISWLARAGRSCGLFFSPRNRGAGLVLSSGSPVLKYDKSLWNPRRTQGAS